MIIYFPVSALVTLFANILQNPQDTRARSDLKLMNLVVSFLSMLCSDEENGSNGSIRRMLSVCSEFERIAKVVLDKADKESSSRRKRKQQQEQAQSLNGGSQAPSTQQQQQQQARARQQPTAPQTPAQQTGNLPNPFTPNFGSDLGDQVSVHAPAPLYTQHFSNPSHQPFPFTPNPPTTFPTTTNWLPDFSPPPGGSSLLPQTTSFADMQYTQPTTNGSGMNGSGMSGFGGLGSGLDIGNTFQHPFVPQDLWQMPMTLEWDWADMTAGALGGFDDGIGMNGINGGLGSGGQGDDEGDAGRQQEQR